MLRSLRVAMGRERYRTASVRKGRKMTFEKSEIEELLTLVEKAKTLAGKLSLEKHNMAINIHLLSAYALLKLKK